MAYAILYLRGGATGEILFDADGFPQFGLGEFWNNGGALAFASAAAAVGYPTSVTGLPPGSLWNNALEVGITTGFIPSGQIIPVYFGGITAAALLAFGGFNLPIAPPAAGSLQIWNNGGVASIA